VVAVVGLYHAGRNICRPLSENGAANCTWTGPSSHPLRVVVLALFLLSAITKARNEVANSKFANAIGTERQLHEISTASSDFSPCVPQDSVPSSSDHHVLEWNLPT
jgi:hypothetical protein